jgi:hypothetical protein
LNSEQLFSIKPVVEVPMKQLITAAEEMVVKKLIVEIISTKLDEFIFACFRIEIFKKKN